MSKTSSLKIKQFQFNSLGVNTFVLYDETSDAIIIDPGMMCAEENEKLQSFISEAALTVKYIVCTHPHFDHVLGNDFCARTFRAPIVMHKAGLDGYLSVPSILVAFGFTTNPIPVPQPDRFVTDGDMLYLGNQQLTVFYTPGHADGSICLYHANSGSLWVGDLLFRGSIGRSDLPTGNHHTLIESLKTKVLLLPDETMVYPGHGETTTIGEEKSSNPFIIRNLG